MMGRDFEELVRIHILDRLLQAHDLWRDEPEGFIRAQDGIKVKLDGAACDGTLLPVATDGKEHKVEIEF